MSNRPLRLAEIVDRYTAEPLAINWRRTTSVVCAVRQKFSHDNLEFRPGRDPRAPEESSFDPDIARGSERKGVIEIVSARVDYGTARLEQYGQVRAFRPWPKSLPDGGPELESMHNPAVYLLCRLVKLVQVFPGRSAELGVNEVFITSYPVINLIGHSVERITGANLGPLEILQP